MTTDPVQISLLGFGRQGIFSIFASEKIEDGHHGDHDKQAPDRPDDSANGTRQEKDEIEHLSILSGIDYIAILCHPIGVTCSPI